MAGFRQGGLSLKKRDNGSASDINFVSFYVDSFDRLYSVDTFGTSALVSNQWSTGCIDENIPELVRTTDNITVPALRVAIFSNPNFRGPLFRKSVGPQSFAIPRDGNSKYIVADYDSGTPYLRIETDRSLINQSNIVCLYIVWNLTGNIHAIEFDNKGEGLANKIDNSIMLTEPYRRSINGGLIISLQSGRYIHITPAQVFAGMISVNVLAFDSQTDRVTEFYHTAGNWTFDETMSGYQVDNQHYDDGTNRVVLGNNKYSCRWIYRTIGDDKEVFVRLGTAEYNSISDAQKEIEPFSPGVVKEHGMLIGRVVIQKGATTGLSESIFTLFGSTQGSSTTVHNDLSNIQGGDQANSEYYHLDYERFLYTSAISADVQTQINDLKMLTSGTGITQVYADAHYLKLDGSNGPITNNLGVVGTISASSVSATNLTATNIQGTTISVGNVSNTEFSRLDGISANIQTQLTNLSASKVDKTVIISAGTGLTGGGDLSQNRTLSLETTGTAGTYTKVTTDQFGRVTTGTSLIASDIPSGIDASKISTGVVSNTEFNQLDGISANIQNQLSTLSATKVNNVTISGTSGLIGGGDLTQNRFIGMPNVGTAGTYTKVTTDQYGRVTVGTTLTSGDIPTLPATKIGSGIVSDTEFNYLDTVSANIQTQFSTLSGTKVDKTITISAGTMLSGGGDLSTNRTISHQTVGTAGTYSNIVTNDTGHITSARNILSGDIPTLPATKIGTGIINDTEFNYLDNVSANIQNQLTTLSATKPNSTTLTAYLPLSGGTMTGNLTVGSNSIIFGSSLYFGRSGDGAAVHFATPSSGTRAFIPATTTTSANADLGTAGYVWRNGYIGNISATSITVGNISNTEFQYLDTVSANIQTQLSNLSANDNNKVDKTISIIAGTGLTGGGTLSANVTVSLPNIGTAGTYTKVSTDAQGRVSAATNITSADLPQIGASKIGSGVISDLEFSYLDTVSANIQSQLSTLSASKINTVDAITYTNTSATLTSFTKPVVFDDGAGGNSYFIFRRVDENNNDFLKYSDTDNSYSFFADSPLSATYPNAKLVAGEINATSLSASSTLLGPTVSVGSISDTSWLKVADFTATDSGTSYKFETTLFGGDWNDQGVARYVYSSFDTKSTTSALNIRRCDVLWDHGSNEIYSNIEWKVFRRIASNGFEIYVRGKSSDFFTLNAKTIRGGKDGLIEIQPIVVTVLPTSATHNEILVVVDEQPVRMLQDSLFVRDISKSRDYNFQYTSADDVMEAKFGNNAFFPSIDNKYSLGSGSNRWANIKTASAEIGNISATTITVGSIDNTEFSFLNGTSANIQTQLSTLSATKADKTTTITAGTGLTGGGDLTTNRTLSLETTGTAGTYTKVTTDQYGRVVVGTTLVASDIPSGIDASKISTGIISNTEFNYLDGISANIQNQLSTLSANTALAANRYSTTITLNVGTNTQTITHNLGILRPHVDLFYGNHVIAASPNYIDVNSFSITTTVPAALNTVYVEVFK